jgi:hypothetical protein
MFEHEKTTAFLCFSIQNKNMSENNIYTPDVMKLTLQEGALLPWRRGTGHPPSTHLSLYPEPCNYPLFIVLHSRSQNNIRAG